jgi:hypothetical protein
VVSASRKLIWVGHVSCKREDKCIEKLFTGLRGIKARKKMRLKNLNLDDGTILIFNIRK